MAVGVDGVKPLNSSSIGQLLPPPAGDFLSVQQSVPISSHAGQSGYAAINQKSMAASSMMPYRDRFSTPPSEWVASRDSWSKVDFISSPIKAEHDLEMDVETID
eukprot:9436330-Karenia_brevis.AAC.1